MSRFPKSVRAASIKCISCNAPVVQTIEGAYACVKCGNSPVEMRSSLDDKISETEIKEVVSD